MSGNNGSTNSRIAAMASIIGVLAIAVAPSRAATDTAAAFANVARKLAVDKKLTVGYIGGSITQGISASNSSTTSWRGLTTAWFKKTYPNATITEINASISSSGSDLAAFRCTRDLTSKNPDLVFIEFSVNDWSTGKQNIQPYAEGLLRNILFKNPNAGIVYVHTVHNNTITYYEKGQLPPAVQAHQEVMDHYGFPSINVGRALYDAIKAGKGTLATFTADGTHPNDAGYKIYATEIQRVLQKFLVPQNPSEFVSWEWPTKTLTPKPLENGLVLKGEDAISAGWSKTAAPDTRFPGGIQANKAGTVLKYAFTGTAIGVHWNEGTSSGEVTWSVDGSTPTKASAYLSKNRGRLRVFTNSLGPGEHVLTLTVLPTKSAASTGTWIRINALMSNPPRIPASISGETTPSHVRGVQPALVDVSGQGTGVRFRRHGTFDALGKSVR